VAISDLINKNELTKDEGFLLCEMIGEEISLELISDRKVDLPFPFALKKPVSDRLIFFPGSFNPWHMGHLECLKGCPKGPIVVIPDRNPWKEVSDINPWDEVVELKEHLLQCDRDDIFIYPGFLALKEKNPTTNWLPQVNVKEKWLLMGDDLFLGLHRWNDIESILASLQGVYVCPRGANKIELQIQMESLQKIQNIEVIFLENHDYEGISSTKLRSK
jgi:nicotinate-nucleotide adenylyltransferase